MQLVTVPHYKTGQPLAVGSETAEHHPYWPRNVFPQRIYREHVLYLTVKEHDEFHAYFANKCDRTFKTGAFKCQDCPSKYREICGWGCMILVHSTCRMPMDCPDDCSLRYTCLDRALQLQFNWE